MNILVTGGAGFVGSHLVDALLARGHKVRVLDALVEQVHGQIDRPAHLDSAAEFIRADVCDHDAVRAALDGIEVVYHQAAEVGVGQSMYEIERYIRANDMGTAVLLQAMIERPQQFKKLVVASSMSIYGEGAYQSEDGSVLHPQLRPSAQLAARRWEAEDAAGRPARPIPTPESKPLFPTSVYAISKQDQEQYCLVVGRAYNIPTVALRYFNIYGPRQALSNPYTGVCAIFSSRFLNDQPPVIFEDGEQARDFVHVSDIVQANLLALETDKADYLPVNVGTGVPTSVKQIASLIAQGLGKNIGPEVVGKYREGDIRHCYADISRARQLLGYEPKVALKDGMSDLLNWVREQTAADRVNAATEELAARQLVR
jgi:dTDP-L-rhamnose 4-epimerase